MQRGVPPPRANEGLPVRAPPGGDQRVGRPSPEEEAGEMKRKHPARPRVKLNRDAVWASLDELGISQNELARRCGLFVPADGRKAQSLAGLPQADSGSDGGA